MMSQNDLPFSSLVECSTGSTPAEGQSCVVVEGAYTIYFAEGSVDNSAVMMRMNDAVRESMDSGEFAGGDINSVVWVESPQPNSAGAVKDSSETIRSTPDDGVESMPIIVGASVGGLAAIALIAFYRRRSLKAQEEDTFMTPADGSSSYAY